MMIFNEPPENFKATIEVAANYCHFEDKLLLLHRSLTCPEPSTWGVPAGKLDEGEKPLDGAIRELYEETGILAHPHQYRFIKTLYIQKEIPFLFHMYYLPFKTRPLLKLSPSEVQEARWIPLGKVREYPLISGGEGALEYLETFLNA